MARKSGEGPARIYEAAQVFVDQALRQIGSLFTPGRPIWSTQAIANLEERFVRRPDTSSDDFETKFLRQLAGAPDRTIQLAGEMLYVHLLISTQLKGQTKRNLIDTLLRTASDPIVVPPTLQPALDSGIANAGQSFLRRRPFLLTFLVEFASGSTSSDHSRMSHSLGGAANCAVTLVTSVDSSLLLRLTFRVEDLRKIILCWQREYELFEGPRVR